MAVVHAPLTQLRPLGHAVGMPHCPLEPHTCTALPEHCVVPGMHRRTVSHPPLTLLFTTDQTLVTPAPPLLPASLTSAPEARFFAATLLTMVKSAHTLPP